MQNLSNKKVILTISGSFLIFAGGYAARQNYTKASISSIGGGLILLLVTCYKTFQNPEALEADQPKKKTPELTIEQIKDIVTKSSTKDQDKQFEPLYKMNQREIKTMFCPVTQDEMLYIFGKMNIVISGYILGCLNTKTAVNILNKISVERGANILFCAMIFGIKKTLKYEKAIKILNNMDKTKAKNIVDEFETITKGISQHYRTIPYKKDRTIISVLSAINSSQSIKILDQMAPRTQATIIKQMTLEKAMPIFLKMSFDRRECIQREIETEARDREEEERKEIEKENKETEEEIRIEEEEEEEKEA